MIVAALCPRELKAWALLHDAHEVFLGDMTTPALEFLCASGTRSSVEHAVANAKGRLDRVIGAAWNVVVQSQNLTIRRADHVAVVAEAWLFMGTRPTLSEPKDRRMIDEAAELIRGLGVVDDLRAKELWLEHVSTLATIGLLTPPTHEPIDMSSFGN